MKISNTIEEDPAADQLWQPIFEKAYPDINQPLYSSHFKKFKVSDVAKNETKVNVTV